MSAGTNSKVINDMSTRLAHAVADDAVQQIVDLAHDFSIEATLPPPADIEALREFAPKGMPVFVSAVPSKPLMSGIEAAVQVRNCGFEPVPHIVARNFPSRQSAEELITRMVGEAGVRRALILAGDLDNPAGDLFDAKALIESGLLQKHGIKQIGISGYPEGHPRISQEKLLEALPGKLAAAKAAGLDVEIVTQFAFDAEAITNWVKQVRQGGHQERIRIGLAGPASFTALLRYAKRCGVKASTRGAARNTGLLKQMFGGMSAPDDIIRALALNGPKGYLGDIALHFFAFGGIPNTARWGTTVSQGRITLDSDDGFSLDV